MVPTRRDGIIAAVALLMVLSGCGGFQDGAGVGDTRNTVAPELRGTANITSVPPPPLRERLPPGLTPTRLDGATLGAFHRANTRPVSRTTVATVRVIAANGTTLGTSRTRTRTEVRERTRRVLVTVTTTGTTPRSVGFRPGKTTYWGNRSVSVSRHVGNGTVTYDTQPGPVPLVVRGGATGLSAVSFVFSLVNLTDLESVGVVNGSERFRIRATARNISALEGWNASLTAVVGSEGVVYSFRFAYTTRQGSRRVRIVRSYRLTKLGNTTAPPPNWVARALNDSDPT